MRPILVTFYIAVRPARRHIPFHPLGAWYVTFYKYGVLVLLLAMFELYKVLGGGGALMRARKR